MTGIRWNRSFTFSVLSLALAFHGPAAAQDVIRIGAVLPVTGKESKIGGAYKQATEFAVKEVNDAGGLDVGRQEDEDRPRPARRHLGRVPRARSSSSSSCAQQKVDAVIGGYGSQLVQAQSVVPERYGVPYISGGAGATRHLRPQQVGLRNAVAGRRPFSDADGVPHSTSSRPGSSRSRSRSRSSRENTEHGKDLREGRHDYVKAHPGSSRSSSTRASSSTPPTSSRC